jgi:hypothetical protein
VSKRLLNKAAPELLSAAKKAVKALQCGELSPDRRTELLKVLQGAIDKAEVPAEWKFSFVVTPRTWEHINEALSAWYVTSPVKTALRELLDGGYRRTARRVYCDVDVDVSALSVFRVVLKAYDPQGATSRAFDRIIEQMDREIFGRSPLEILAETGL